MSPTFAPLQQAARFDEEQLALYFIARTENSEDDSRLLEAARAGEDLLRHELSRAVPGLLGSSFQLQKIEIRRGSVQIWVYVAGGFTLISQYTDFVRSLELLLQHIVDMLQAIFAKAGLREVSIAKGWTSAVPQRRRFAFPASRDAVTLLLASYLILSHAVLLVLLISVVVRLLLN